MRALPTFDLYLWNRYVPQLNEERFKNRVFCLAALTYIAVYSLPRRFLIHYFRGNGKDIVIDSTRLIMNTPVILSNLSEAITKYRNSGLTDGSFAVCQTDVDDPNYKYSLGSFRVNYAVRNESMEIVIHSGYHFQYNPHRLTRHLHSWLYAMTKKGYAASFNVKSLPLTLTFSELVAAKLNSTPQRLSKLAVLV